MFLITLAFRRIQTRSLFLVGECRCFFQNSDGHRPRGLRSSRQLSMYFGTPMELKLPPTPKVTYEVSAHRLSTRNVALVSES